MTDQTEAKATPKADAEAASTEGKTVVRPDVSTYTKARTAAGSLSHHSGDIVAKALEGLTVDEVISMAVKVTGDKELETKYTHLNVGMQRMNLGNKMRGAISKKNKANEVALAKLKEGEPEPEQVSGEDSFAKLAEPFAVKAQKRAAEYEAEQKAKAEAKAKKDAETAAKAEKAPAAAKAAKS